MAIFNSYVSLPEGNLPRCQKWTDPLRQLVEFPLFAAGSTGSCLGWAWPTGRIFSWANGFAWTWGTPFGSIWGHYIKVKMMINDWMEWGIVCTCMYYIVLPCLKKHTHRMRNFLVAWTRAIPSSSRSLNWRTQPTQLLAGAQVQPLVAGGFQGIGGFSSHPIFFIARWRQRFGQLWWSSGLCHTVVSTSLKLRETHWVLQHLADVSAATSYKLLLVDLQLKLFGHESGFSQTSMPRLFVFSLCGSVGFSTWGQARTSQPAQLLEVLSQGLQACNSSRSVQPVEHAERSIPSHCRSLNWTDCADMQWHAPWMAISAKVMRIQVNWVFLDFQTQPLVTLVLFNTF